MRVIVDAQGRIVSQVQLLDNNSNISFVQKIHLGWRLYQRESRDIFALIEKNNEAANDYGHCIRFTMGDCHFSPFAKIDTLFVGVSRNAVQGFIR